MDNKSHRIMLISHDSAGEEEGNEKKQKAKSDFRDPLVPNVGFCTLCICTTSRFQGYIGMPRFDRKRY